MAAVGIEALDALLPQTQCTRCGYPACRDYARAISEGEAINRCPPGGAAGIERLARLTGREVIPLDPQCGVERPVEVVARIVEADCIGCTKCIQACPVDAIVGAMNRMHDVIEDDCNGCELCIEPCPVDCIELVEVPGRAPAFEQAGLHRARFEAHRQRLALQEQALREARHGRKADALAALARAGILS